MAEEDFHRAKQEFQQAIEVFKIAIEVDERDMFDEMGECITDAFDGQFQLVED